MPNRGGCRLIIRVFDDGNALGKAAAADAAAILRRAVNESGIARVVAATGASQIQFLDSLTKLPGIDWQNVELFQLDEYIGLSKTHPASFTKYLQDRLASKKGILHYHALNGAANPVEVARVAGEALLAAPVDVAFVGIGENGHLAFNDPPADFETREPYIIVSLDEQCRRQQTGEGWFADLSEVPKQAISMSINQILTAKNIIAVVPEARKAEAVKNCFEGPVSPMRPASALRTHPHATVYLDKLSAALLSPTTLSSLAAGA
jgi:glucosamine-6-phosphate deaminase